MTPGEYRYSTGTGGVIRCRDGDAITRVRYADSYSRLGAVLECSRRSQFWSILGQEWSCCDNISSHKRALYRVLSRRLDAFPIADAMTGEEMVFYRLLPGTVTVWRGCYANNVDGFSWSLERDVAAAFPGLRRYHQSSRPLLVQGHVRKEHVAFIKLDREEHEVVTLPELVRQESHWLL